MFVQVDQDGFWQFKSYICQELVSRWFCRFHHIWNILTPILPNIRYVGNEPKLFKLGETEIPYASKNKYWISYVWI